jgi:hypothetical protein
LLRSSALTIKRASSNELLGSNNLRGHRSQKSSPQSGGIARLRRPNGLRLTRNRQHFDDLDRVAGENAEMRVF